MNYFEFKEPYYSLIKADGFDEAIDIYEEHITKIEINNGIDKKDQFRFRQHKIKSAKIKIIRYAHVLAKVHKALGNDCTYETEDFIEDNHGLLLIDYDLL